MFSKKITKQYTNQYIHYVRSYKCAWQSEQKGASWMHARCWTGSLSFASFWNPTKCDTLQPYILRPITVSHAPGIFPPDFAVRNVITFHEIQSLDLLKHPWSTHLPRNHWIAEVSRTCIHISYVSFCVNVKLSHWSRMYFIQQKDLW